MQFLIISRYYYCIVVDICSIHYDKPMTYLKNIKSTSDFLYFKLYLACLTSRKQDEFIFITLTLILNEGKLTIVGFFFTKVEFIIIRCSVWNCSVFCEILIYRISFCFHVMFFSRKPEPQTIDKRTANVSIV